MDQSPRCCVPGFFFYKIDSLVLENKISFKYQKLRETFSKFYRRHYELISKCNDGLKKLLRDGLSEPEFYGDLVYKL